MSNIVAETILEQLGGNKFRVMTGAKGFVSSSKTLTFRIGRNSHKITAVDIELMPTDLYAMTFYRGSGLKLREYTKTVGLYADMLQREFTSVTGLDTHL